MKFFDQLNHLINVTTTVMAKVQLYLLAVLR